MKKTIFAFLILNLFLMVSCGNQKLELASKIRNEFVQQNQIDKRETIFEIGVEIKDGKLVLTGETDDLQLKEKLILAFAPMEVIDHIIELPDSTVGNKKFGLINLSVANLRSEPTHSAELATQALLGTPVKILKIRDGWYQIQTPDKYISWVDGDGIFPMTETQISDWKHAERILFTGENTLVFETPQCEKPVTDLTMGNICEKLDENGKTIKVKLPDGRTGYVSPANFINFNNYKDTVQANQFKIRQIAWQFTGRPYLWGGTSARAMDCSGFVKTIFFMNGIILARDASLQTRYGQLIEPTENFENLEIGDLLFFGKKKTDETPEKVTHVALSLSGTEYIHASGRIKQNSFNPQSSIYSEYRQNSFVRARRIIGADGFPGIQKIKEHPWY